VKSCGTVNLKGVSGSTRNSGDPFKSTTLVCFDGELIRYGDGAITYANPPASYAAAGKLLFDQTCSSCHGSDANGISPSGQATIGPNLQGVGAATVDFWVTTGRMPATDVAAVEAERKPPKLTDKEALEVAAYINSLDPSVPAVPTPNLKGANVADGASLFALNCAACHTITGAGDALANSTNAPSLQNRQVTPQQVAEAMRIGPANMPRFSGNLSDAQVRDVVAYVTEYIQHPTNPGGAGLGGVGPVAEGFVALLIGVGGLALVCFWIGERS
jgi:ubiquinol-cytochrome c reductase cytochrome c subunit